MIIRSLGQSGYIVRTSKTTVVIDPYLSDSVNKAAGRPRALPIPVQPQDIRCDAVICTHDHLDHLDTETVKGIFSQQLFLTTKKGSELLRRLGRTNVKVLEQGQTVTVGDISITAVFADHSTEAFGIILKAEEKTLYFSGDTLYHENLLKIAAYHPDITLICINGKLGNMNVGQALAVARKLGAKVNIPNHYDMFLSNSEDPHLFADHIQGGCILEFNREYDVDQLLKESACK